MSDTYGSAENPVRVDDLTSLTYKDSSGVEHPYPTNMHSLHTIVQRADGTIVDQVAYDKDVIGFTDPNLHRRIDPQDPPEPEDPNYDPKDPKSVNRAYLNQEISPRSYDINIHGVHSYRTTTIHTHDEESITTEIP